MSRSESSLPPETDDLLAPPPFGVSEATSGQLLPTPTSMGELLDAPEPGPEPELAPSPDLEDGESARSEDGAPDEVLEDDPLAGLRSRALSQGPEPAGSVLPTAAQAEPNRPAGPSGPTIALAAIVILGLGGLTGWLLSSRAPQEGTEDSAVAPAAAGPESPRPAEPAQAPQEHAPPSALPASRAELRSMSFQDRHSLLARTRGQVAVEDHVGLDLLQADQADDPCRTFADALSTIEASEDPETYRWALNDATAPKGSETACDGLPARLAALNAPPAEPTPPRVLPKSKRPGRKKPRTPRPAATPPAPQPSAKPPARTPSVATKLDDDLRGLGD